MNISNFIKTNRVYFIWAAFAGLLYLFRHMFGLVFLTFIMCFIASSAVRLLRRKFHLNRRFILISFYILFFLIIVLFLSIVPSRILSETINFTEQLKNSIGTINTWMSDNLGNNETYVALREQINQMIFPETYITGVWEFIYGLLQKALHYFSWFFIALLFSFLITLDLPHLTKGVRHLRDTRLSDFYHETADSIVLFAKVVGENFRAQLFISTLNTILTAICLNLLGIKAVVLLCTIVFICGLIPVLGMLISSVPIVLMAINSGGIELGLWALLIIIGIHMLETYVFNPYIVSSVMRINPVMTLIILYVAHSIMGMWGMLLGVPIAVYLYRKIDYVPSAVRKKKKAAVK